MKALQRGVTLIEVLGALAIGSVLMLGLSQMINTTLDDAKGQQASLFQAQITAAAAKYISAHYSDLLISTGGGVVAPVTLTQLKNDNFLPNGFGPVNAYQQNVCVLVRQSVPNKLDALVVAYGGQPIPEKLLPAVAFNAGQGGGYISVNTPGKAQGASWKLADTTPFRSVSCSGSTVLTGGAADGGHLVSSLFYDGPGNLAADFLYRNDVGNPQLNTMNTSVRLAGGGLVTIGSDCKVGGVPVPGIAIDAVTKQLVICNDSGLWASNSSSSQWKEAVNTYGDLGSLTGTGEGDVRMVKNVGRAFTYHGGNWVALSVDQNGDLNVPRNIFANSNITSSGYMYSMSNITANGYIYALGDLCTDSDLDVSGNAYLANDLNVKGDIYTSGITSDWSYSGHYEIDEVFNPGDRCNYPATDGKTWWREFPIGSIVQDSHGVLLSCYSVNETTIGTFRYANGKTTMPQ